MIQTLCIYLGGVIALLCESLVQWLHPAESEFDESFFDAILAAALWPLMATTAIVEFLFKRKKDD